MHLIQYIIQTFHSAMLFIACNKNIDYFEYNILNIIVSLDLTIN